MTALVFPPNPTIGQTFSQGENVYQWDGVSWVARGLETYEVYQGEYSPAKQYAIGQIVSFGSTTWLALTVNTGISPVEGPNWAQVSFATLQVGKGGTGANTLPQGAVLVGNGSSPVTGVAPGANGNILVSNGTTWVSATPPPPSVDETLLQTWFLS